MNTQLEGKVAVITGGAQGVGFGIAQEFIDNGASVVLTGRRRGALDEAVARLGAKSSGVVADVSKLSDMEAMFKEVIARHGRLDTVVANAITNANGPLGTITEAQWDHTFNTNAKGVLFSIQPALPLMKPGGTIVIIGSTASVSPPPSMSLYGGAKAAVRCMVRRRGTLCRRRHGASLRRVAQERRISPGRLPARTPANDVSPRRRWGATEGGRDVT